MRIAIAQINSTVGDFEANASKILLAYEKATNAKADILITPELSLCGYPPYQLIHNLSFLQACTRATERLITHTKHTILLIGTLTVNESGKVYNSALLSKDGKILTIIHKSNLTRYGYVDEVGTISPAPENLPIQLETYKIGITISHDILDEKDCPRYQLVESLVNNGANFIINIAALHWYKTREKKILSAISTLSNQYGRPFIFCNLVGGNDALIFYGESFVCYPSINSVVKCKFCEEDFIVIDINNPPQNTTHDSAQVNEELVFKALVRGTADYVQKSGFKSVVLGLSGGIDSAVVACIAARAVGEKNVLAVALPSQYTSKINLEDAKELASRLGIEFTVLPIHSAWDTMRNELRALFKESEEDVTEENLQARIRGVYLMALANKFGHLLLATGNKSEIATGYCTLYGDTCGAIAVIGDLLKTEVYKLARWINTQQELIPISVLTKAPSAELRPGQVDQEKLPPYEILDQIIQAYIMEGKSPQQIIKEGIDPYTLAYSLNLIYRNEFKRRQAPMILKVSHVTFGIEILFPVVHKFTLFPQL